MGNFNSLEPELQNLIAQAQGGDQAAYSQALEILYPYILGIIRSKLGGIADCDDLTQECLIGIHKNLATFDRDKPLKPWISAIIRYKLADYFRAQSRRKEQNIDDNVTNQSVDANSTMNPTSEDVLGLLEALPKKLQRALVLTQLDGLSYQEAADKEGVSEPALRKRISRGYLELRKIVKTKFEIDWN